MDAGKGRANTAEDASRQAPKAHGKNGSSAAEEPAAGVSGMKVCPALAQELTYGQPGVGQL